MSEYRAPRVEFLVPAANENRWSDALASLIATDPTPIAALIGAEPTEVLREVPVASVGGRKVDRLDFLLMRDGRRIAAIEAKLFSDYGVEQLERYSASFPDVDRQFVLHLESLPLDLHDGWESLTWEDVIAAYAASKHPWVRATAQAWLLKLPDLVPRVDGATVWNAVSDDGARFELELRSRTAWLATQMTSWCRVEHALEMSSGGGAWVAAMRSPIPGTGHSVVAEVQEGLDARSWKPVEGKTYRERLRGPLVLVGLARFGEPTSANFNWDLLRRVFAGRIIDETGTPIDGRNWITTAANPRNAIDRAAQKVMVAAGAPKWLGKGYGMATAKTHKVCAFGARLELPAGATLAAIDEELRRLEELVVDVSTALANR